jgi:ABC-2 type transport system permease protein
MAEARARKATGFRLFWNTVLARAYPRIIGLTRERSWMFFDTILPLMGTVSYIFVYKAVNAPEEYIGFVVVGGAMTAFWLNVLWSMASQLYWDKEDGNLEAYILCPGPMMAILLGMALGGIFMAATRAIVIVVVCSLAFHVSYQLGSLPLLVLVFATTMTALYGMGMMFASIFLAAGREAWHFVTLLQEPVYLLSGMYFPVKSLGFWAATVASLIPLTLGLDAMRQLLFPGGANGFLPVLTELGLLGVFSVLFIAGAWAALRKLESIGRREGRLIERRR